MSKHFQKIKEQYKNTKKKSLLVYIILRLLVIISMVLSILRKDFNSAALCFLSLFLFTLPTFIQEKFKIELPSLLEGIVYAFIFAAEILGEINNFYGIIPYWDTILHTLNGFLAAAIGFSLVDILNTKVKNFNLSPFFVALVAFSFSMTIGVLWEFFEYSMDKYLSLDMQKDSIVTKISSVNLDPDNSNKVVVVKDIYETDIVTKEGIVVIDGGYLDIGINDTMEDLFVNFLGAVVFSIFGYLYILNRDKYQFVNNFIPKKLTNAK